MNKWMFKALIVAVITAGIIAVQIIIKTNKAQEMCLANIVMVKHDDMYVQKDLWPQHCVPISKD